MDTTKPSKPGLSAQIIPFVPRSKAADNIATIVTSLHLDISKDGHIDSKPLRVHQAQALALLSILLPVAHHVLDVHRSGGIA